MKAYLEQVGINEASSIKAKTYVRSSLDVPLHYHPEHEIVFVLKGRGELYVADSASTFSEGEVFLIGSGVPHLFADAQPAGSHTARVVVIQFRENLFTNLSLLPEFARTGQLLQQINKGIKVTGLGHTAPLFIGLSHAKGIEKFNRLSYLLDLIIEKGNCTTIASRMPVKEQRSAGAVRLQELFRFLQENYNRDITVEEAAHFAHLGKSSFCRYLKKQTGKTFSELLNETRITAACTLLREKNLTATEVCYQTGFNNPGYFFRQFKQFRGVSPNAYRQRFCSQ